MTSLLYHESKIECGVKCEMRYFVCNFCSDRLFSSISVFFTSGPCRLAGLTGLVRASFGLRMGIQGRGLWPQHQPPLPESRPYYLRIQRMLGRWHPCAGHIQCQSSSLQGSGSTDDRRSCTLTSRRCSLNTEESLNEDLPTTDNDNAKLNAR